MQVRHPNQVTTTNDAEGFAVKTVKTFNLGHWEMWKLQEAIALLPEEDRTHMEYLAYVLGSCPETEVTITATYEM